MKALLHDTLGIATLGSIRLALVPFRSLPVSAPVFAVTIAVLVARELVELGLHCRLQQRCLPAGGGQLSGTPCACDETARVVACIR